MTGTPDGADRRPQPRDDAGPPPVPRAGSEPGPPAEPGGGSEPGSPPVPGSPPGLGAGPVPGPPLMPGAGSEPGPRPGLGAGPEPDPPPVPRVGAQPDPLPVPGPPSVPGPRGKAGAASAPSAPVGAHRRVAVTAPRRVRARGYSARARAADLHAQPQLGQVYVRSLVRNQLRLALGVLAVLAAVLGGLPAAFALLPGLRTADVLGVRLAWLLLGVVAYPLLVGAAFFHVRHAERVERDFTDLLAGPDTPPAGGEAEPQ